MASIKSLAAPGLVGKLPTANSKFPVRAFSTRETRQLHQDAFVRNRDALSFGKERPAGVAYPIGVSDGYMYFSIVPRGEDPATANIARIGRMKGATVGSPTEFSTTSILVRKPLGPM